MLIAQSVLDEQTSDLKRSCKPQRLQARRDVRLPISEKIELIAVRIIVIGAEIASISATKTFDMQRIMDKLVSLSDALPDSIKKATEDE